MSDRTLSVLDGSTFVVGDRLGDLRADEGREHGFFSDAMFAAASHFEYRLPEVFAGFPRSVTSIPVAYPTASRPQAWAAATPLLLLTTLLQPEPGATDVSSNGTSPVGHLKLHR